MHHSYIDYAMSVIVGRALPDVRDGLKPVQRRILWSMWESGATHDRPYRKSARTVGDVLGKYHPHGDMAVYDAMVRMAQDFSLRYLLIDGQGNFGSVDGDTAAAMRYTEARLSPLAAEVLADNEKETVAWFDNFDGTLKEPKILPSKLPNLLVNGAAGIAVGMATVMAPHNLGEVVDALLKVLQRPETTLDEIMEVLPAPDFPTGGLIARNEGIRESYETGRGTIRLRAKADIRERDNRNEIVVTEIPYEVNKAQMLEKVATLVKDKRIEGISDMRDESDKDGISVVFELKRDAQPEIVLNQLYQHSDLEHTIGLINLALVNDRPRVLGLKTMLQLHIDHRREIITRRSEFDLKKAQDRLHILQGFLVAIENIEEIIKIIRRSKDVPAAQASLMGKFLLSEEQAKAILDMRLSRLTALERESVTLEAREKEAEIKGLKEILGSKTVLDKVLSDELKELKARYGDPRRTMIVEGFTERTLEDLIPEMQVVVLGTHDGYIKRLPLDTYRSQRRGGKGLIQMETKEQDFVTRAFVTGTHDHILFFTNLGRVYRLKAYEVPEGGRHTKGKAIINLLPKLQDGEHVQAELPIGDLSQEGFLIFASAKGVVKRTELSQFRNIRTNGIRAVLLEEGDELVEVAHTLGKSEILLATRNGQLVRFSEQQVRSMGRNTYGVIGARLKGKDDRVVSMGVVTEALPSLLTITSTGYGKRTALDEYRFTNRGAHGVITIKTGGRNGNVVAAFPVSEEDEFMATTKNGIVLRSPMKQVREQGRNTLGVRLIRLEESDTVETAFRLVPPGEEEAGKDGATPPKTQDTA
jgi:DNA gyrase subunit A